MTAQEAKHTPGPWKSSKGSPVKQSNFGRYRTSIYKSYLVDGEPHMGESVIITADTPELAKQIADLAAEAGTVAHETGLTPRQLADEVEKQKHAVDHFSSEMFRQDKEIAKLTFQRDELLEALKLARKCIAYCLQTAQKLSIYESLIR